MKSLTISQVTACVNSAIRGMKQAVTIDYTALTEALNAVLSTDLKSLPESPLQWCDVCQRNVEASHAHDKMV